MENTPQKKPTGRPSKDDSKKKQKFGSTIPPELKDQAESYMNLHGLDGSQFLELALKTLLQKERGKRAIRRCITPNDLNTLRD